MRYPKKPDSALTRAPNTSLGRAGLLPLAGFQAYAATELAPLVDEGELWLFAQVGADDENAFRESSSDLLVQLKTVEQLPVCVLALSDTRGHAVRRAYLNPAPSADGPILDLLRHDFHANVIVYSTQRRLLRSFRVEAPRAENVELIICTAKRGPRSEPTRWQQAAAACRLSPPPIGGCTHPFVVQDPATTAGEALRRLQCLEAWASPEKAQEALHILSVPKTVFELSKRRTISDAATFGLAMSNALLFQAVRFGFAEGAGELVNELQRRFEQIVSTASTQGLDAGQIEANRRALGRLVSQYGTSTGPGLSCTMNLSR